MLKKVNTNEIIRKNLLQTKTHILPLKHTQIVTSKLIIKDMMFYLKIWRLVRGYSSLGHRTHSNNKSNKKTKIINQFRLQQFYQLFGRKKRDIFPVLILAEYNNRLWFVMWNREWMMGKVFLFRLLAKNKNKAKFDPHLLSKNIVTGLIKVKKKKKHNTAKKKIIMVVTIGLPILFSLYLYNYKNKYRLPFELSIPDESRRKMARKGKKK